MEESELMQVLGGFALAAPAVQIERHGSGHINRTYRAVCENGHAYVLQRINTHVFAEPEALMRNIALVTRHIRKKVGSDREVLTLVPTLDGRDYLFAADGYWRVSEFVSGSVCFDAADTPELFATSAVAFGRFCEQLADFPASALAETIPHFHDTPARYAALRAAEARDACGRAGQVSKELAFAYGQEPFITALYGDPIHALPLRVTHNDTKINNVLFDRNTREPLCVLDLDTVMPGLLIHDFGDAIRFGASSASEDETELARVSMRLDFFAAYVRGFLRTCAHSLTPAELALLPEGAKQMTLECGIRFLADYLDGDRYFATARPTHNLDRCRTQFALVADMDAKWNEMREIVREEAERAGIRA